MRMKGVILNGLLSNATNVLTIMDEIFHAFKNALHLSTHQQFARKIKVNEKAIMRRKNTIAEKVAAGIAVFEKTDQAYTWCKDTSSLLTKIGTDDLKHLICFLCRVKKTKDNTFSKHSGNKKKIRD